MYLCYKIVENILTISDQRNNCLAFSLPVVTVVVVILLSSSWFDRNHHRHHFTPFIVFFTLAHFSTTIISVNLG